MARVKIKKAGMFNPGLFPRWYKRGEILNLPDQAARSLVASGRVEVLYYDLAEAEDYMSRRKT